MATISEPRVTITVPAEYVDDVRAAVVAVLSFDADQSDAFAEDRERQVAAVRHDLELLDQLLEASGDVELEGERDTLLYVLQEMGKLLTKRLRDEFSIGPPDMEAILKVTDRLRWSVITHGEAVA